VFPILSVILTKYHLYNNIVLSMLYAEICPKVRRDNARALTLGHISAYNMDNTILLLLLL
jgi:hypothetical protein